MYSATIKVCQARRYQLSKGVVAVVLPHKEKGFSLLTLVFILVYVGAMGTFFADLVQQRYLVGDSRFFPLDATRSQFLSLAGLEVMKGEVAVNPDFTLSDNWCAEGVGGPRQPPYTQWRDFRLNYGHNQGFFRIRYGPWLWSWSCNLSGTPPHQQILGSSLGRFCQAGGCGAQHEWPTDNLRLFFRKTFDKYTYNDEWWEANGEYKDTIVNYASGGGNDNAGRALLYTSNTGSWYYDKGYCATPNWKKYGWGWNPYYHGAWGGQYMGNDTGVFAPIGFWYRAIRWSRLAHTDYIPKDSHTILDTTPWSHTSNDGSYTYTRTDTGISMQMWFKGGYTCAGNAPLCSIVNKGWGPTNISYGMFLNQSTGQVEFRLNMQDIGLQTLVLPYDLNADTDWHFLVGTYDYETGWMRFYEAPKGGTIQTNSQNIGSHYIVPKSASIGIAQDANEQYRFNSYISEFRLTNYAIDTRYDPDDPLYDDPDVVDMSQVNFWHQNTTNKVHAEEAVAGGCTKEWTQPDTTARYENWW